jgi:hypothetical protein
MAMLIAWQTVNAVRRSGSKRFTRGFLVVTPGITIRDRLRVLQPNDPDSYYKNRELIPDDMLGDLDRAKNSCRASRWPTTSPVRRCPSSTTSGSTSAAKCPGKDAESRRQSDLRYAGHPHPPARRQLGSFGRRRVYPIPVI